MGTGKTTVAQAIADQLQWPCMDSDEVVVALAGQSIPEIFSQAGEAEFRKYERNALKQCVQQEPLVLATGGGAIVDAENFELLNQSGFMALLTAPAETILQRVQSSGDRPLLRVADPKAEILRLIDERRPFYDKVSYVFETTEKSPDALAAEIIAGFQGWYTTP